MVDAGIIEGMTMTRKDYELIAKALRCARDNGNNWSTAVMEIADALRGENPRFDKSKFYDACGFGTKD